MEKTNGFINALNTAQAYTENGAISNYTTGSKFADQFGKAGNYRDRDLKEVFADQEALWNENPEMALRFIFYLCMITRKVKVNEEYVTDKVQKGQGARDESFKRLLWLAKYHQDVFNNNIWLLPVIGSWKDVWTLMFLDVELEVYAINREVMFVLLAEGMKIDAHVNNIKKYMPRIKSSSKWLTDWTRITTALAKEFADYMHWKYIKQYNKFKSSGTAHEFQKLMCSQKYDHIRWNLIPGKALLNIVNSKFLKRHDLTENYLTWLDTKGTVPFNGYVFELLNAWRKTNGKQAKIITLNKQFDRLIETAEADGKVQGNTWVALDTSGSMMAQTSAGVSAYDMCISLGIYFASLNKGAFHKNVVMFDDTSRILQLKGDFCDMANSIVCASTAWGSTNFQSIIRLMCRVRKEHPEIPIEDFPTTILVVSDMQFNPVGGNIETNYQAAKSMLSNYFPKEYVDSIKFVWWDCISRCKNDFPATIDDSGCYFLSGFDGAIISLLLGVDYETNEGEKKAMPSQEELMKMALSQEILQQLSVGKE